MLFRFNSDEHFNYVEEEFMESLDVLCQDESQLLCILRKQKTTTFCRENLKKFYTEIRVVPIIHLTIRLIRTTPFKLFYNYAV
jgi:hypothetical protein